MAVIKLGLDEAGSHVLPKGLGAFCRAFVAFENFAQMPAAFAPSPAIGGSLEHGWLEIVQ